MIGAVGAGVTSAAGDRVVALCWAVLPKKWWWRRTDARRFRTAWISIRRRTDAGLRHLAARAAEQGRLKAGETLLVLGAAGGVGLAAVEIGRAMGARVVAAASTDEKLELARAHGAELSINYATGDLKAELKRLVPAGVDVVYDPVGGAQTEPAVRGLGWGGRLLVMGFANGEIPKLPLNLLLLKEGEAIGVFSGAPGRSATPPATPPTLRA